MYKLFIALSVSALVAGPAAATDKTEVAAVVHQWVSSFNKNDMASMAAVCTDEAFIIDDIPPHQWHGAGACSKWSSAFQAFAESDKITHPAVSVEKAWHIDVTADVAYFVAPTLFSFKRKGKPFQDKGVVTIALQKGAAGWRITGWAWADR
jgi:ketosteroid isomerase-like protein